MSDIGNPVVKNLRHFDQKMDDLNDQMNNFLDQEAHGEEPDPTEFQRMLEEKSVTKTAMTAQFNLNQKPLKTVLNDAK
jgi:hypothetical protein